ncbi:hypothetical protein ACFQU2_16790 [Siccirubricoccus deserti]
MLLALCGCRREAREVRLDPPVAAALAGVAAMPNGIGGRPPEVYFVLGKPYRGNAYQLSEGKRLYAWFGCPECHRDGEEAGAGPRCSMAGGTMGPESKPSTCPSGMAGLAACRPTARG